MAILGKITAEVLVDGKALQEYEDDDIKNHNPNLAVKYIEATSGANFHIRVSILSSFMITSDAISLEVFLDGNNVENVMPYNHQIVKSDTPFCHLFQGSETKGDEGWSRQAFHFSEITRSMCPYCRDDVHCLSSS